MHETAIAESILHTILENAEQMRAKPLRAAISCGQFNTINDECLRFAFEAAAAGTVCEGMTLTVNHIPLRATCKHCQTTFEFDIYQPMCRQCDSMEFDFEPDAPLLLEEIEFAENS